MFRRCLGSCTAVFPLVALISGDLSAQDALTRAVDQLVDAKKKEHGIAVLVAAGERSIPPLRKRLKHCLDEGESAEAMVIGILEALGRVGLPAQAALPEIHDAYMFGSLAASNLAMWTATIVAVASDRDEDLRTGGTRCDEVASWLEVDWRPKADGTRYWWAQARLGLGTRPSEQGILELLEQGSVSSSAAAHAAAGLGHISRDLRGTLQAALVEATSRPDVPWLRPLHHSAAEGDLALALLKHGERTTPVALGLLEHWQARNRINGLSMLAATNSLSVEQRLTLVRRLWDSDRQVRDHTIGTLQGMGPSAIVALRALRAFEADQGTDRSAALYRRCAERIVATVCENTTPAAAELVRHADAVLQGLPWTGPITACDQAASALLAEIVTGSRGALGQTLPQLAALAVARDAFKVGGPSPLRTAFLAALHTDSLEAWTGASDALIVIGPDVTRDAAGFRQLLADSLIAAGQVDLTGLAFAVEAKTLAGQHASVDELRALMSSSEWHLVTHALIELQERDALERRDLKLLQTLAATSLPGFSISSSAEFRRATGIWQSTWSGPAPHQAVHAISALALASFDKTPWTSAICAMDLAAELSVGTGYLPDYMRTVCAQRSFVKHQRTIEERAWSKSFWLHRLR